MVLPVTPGRTSASNAPQSRAAGGLAGSTSHGCENGTVDLISKVVSNAPGKLSSAMHSSATSSRLILPYGMGGCCILVMGDQR